MTDLIPISALGSREPAKLQHGVLTIAENPDLGLASLALRRGDCAPDLGVKLPGPGGWVSGEGIGAFWIGPDQWMIEGQGRASADFLHQVSRLAPGCSVTEQTDAFVDFEITSQEGGAPVRALMEKLVNIDTAAFGPGRATRTRLEHMSVFIIRRAEDRLAVMGMRSLAGSLWHALQTAAWRLNHE